MKNKNSIIIFFFLLFSCEKRIIIPSEFIDGRDGKTYKTALFGKQIWMTENLCYEIDSTYERPIGSRKDHEFDSLYGKLYRWEDACNACPKGWHLPSNSEWLEFECFLGLEKDSIGIHYNVKKAKLGEKLKDAEAWKEPSNDETSIGWNALPAGFMETFGGKKGYLYPRYTGTQAVFWTATSIDSLKYGRALSRCFFENSSVFYHEINLKYSAYSVRCVKNE